MCTLKINKDNKVFELFLKSFLRQLKYVYGGGRKLYKLFLLPFVNMNIFKKVRVLSPTPPSLFYRFVLVISRIRYSSEQVYMR